MSDENFDIKIVIKNLSNYTSKKICSMIVCDRYLGVDEKLVIACMEELGKRRGNGDVFEFESYIDEEFKKLPKLDFSIPDLRTAINNMIPGNIK